MVPANGTAGDETVVGRPAWQAVLVWVGFPVAGALLGLGLRPLAEWILDVDWIPDFGLAHVVAELPQAQGTIGAVVAVVAGVVLGVVLALTAEGEVLRVGVGTGRVSLTRDGDTRTVQRADVHSVFMDGKALVLLGRHGDELAREPSDLAAARLEAAFTAHGYPWSSADPHRDAYRRWVPETPDLPPGADAVLKARQRALEQGGKDDATELRDELARLGVVVRDEDEKQYWRHARIGG
ncbi:hypothetical protein E1269_29235 [Jiangella asiatica]|uniref:DUF308 domain-containing protein n=1 Tax=Jiangella asiatica TaxID=2530372 RepID=A0A4R5CGE1_9ACTN|nr:hypothetical protein E1269_29235 [Jiangella asiatica]